MSCNKLLRIPPKEELDRVVKGFQKYSTLHRKETSCALPGSDKLITAKYNFHMTSIFKSFMNGVLLKHIPASLTLYSDKQVVSCDVAALMQYTLQCASPSSNVADEFGIMCERKRFIENVVDSPSFLNFIARHGYALNYFH